MTAIRKIRADPASADDRDRGSLVLAVVVVMVGVMLATMMLPIVLSQLVTTRVDERRAHELHAAEAGLDVALAHIRAAHDAAGAGVLAALPCSVLTGPVGSGGTARYQVSVSYYRTDPHGQDTAWLADAANQVTCLPGGGARSTPGFAVLRSLGTDSATGSFDKVPVRILQATYVFRTSTANTTGGAINTMKSGSADLCLDAGSPTPLSQSVLTVGSCASDNPAQRFSYTSNLSLALVSSRTVALPLGMCVSAALPHQAGEIVSMAACATTTTPQQQWTVTGLQEFGATADGNTGDGYCLAVRTPNTAGSPLTVDGCATAIGAAQSFYPAAGVGARAAGAAQGQLVDYAQFGRCLDVTNEYTASPFLITYYCKQVSASSSWNQSWLTPVVPAGATSATGSITTNPGSPYCLTSPGSPGAGYPTVVGCRPDAPTRDQTWTVRTLTDSHATSYRIEDANGYCLQATDPTAAAPDLYGGTFSKIVLATCDASALQKWNAPPNFDAPPLIDIIEK